MYSLPNLLFALIVVGIFLALFPVDPLVKNLIYAIIAISVVILLFNVSLGGGHLFFLH